MTTEPLVSVVTPVHNGAEYLEESAASVLNQTYSNWTYTIVDNASTDGTREIGERFAALDSRIRYLRFDEFVDAIENHNRAFRAVDPASEFCKVVQADDWIHPECLASMVEVAERSDSIGLVTSYRLSADGVDLVGLPYDRAVFDGKEILRGELLREKVVVGGPTSMLLRTKFIAERDPPFYKQPGWAADTESAYWMLSRHNFGFVHQVLTYERRQVGRRLDYTRTMNALAPEFLLLNLEHGPAVLSDSEYRRIVRGLLRRYLWWHVRQVPRPSRLNDPEFFAMHEEACRRILAVGGDDRQVRLTMSIVGLLLARDRLRPKRR